MATKKTAKKQERVIDMTEDKTSPFVSGLVRGVTKEFRNILKKSNIAAFDQIYLQKDITQYFMNRSLYTTIFDQDTLTIFDEAMHTAVAKVVSNTVNGMLTVDNCVVPGYWEVETLVLAMTHIAILPETNNPNRWYLSTKLGATSISEGEIAAIIDEGRIPYAMEFSEYNPNRLVQIMHQLMILIYNTILAEVKNRYPIAKLSGTGKEDDPIATVRYVGDLRSFVRWQISKGEEYDFSNFADYKKNAPTDRNVEQFISMVEPGILVYITSLMRTGGISDELVKNIVGRMKINVVFNNAEATDLGKCEVTYIIAISDTTPKQGDKPIQMSFDYTISEMADIVADTMSITRVKSFGSKLKNLLNNSVALAMSVAIVDGEIKRNQEVDELESLV